MRIGNSKQYIKDFVKNNKKDFLLKVWQEIGKLSFIGGYPLGGAYIDLRASGDLVDYFYLYLDDAIAEKYPEIAGKYQRDLLK